MKFYCCYYLFASVSVYLIVHALLSLALCRLTLRCISTLLKLSFSRIWRVSWRSIVKSMHSASVHNWFVLGLCPGESVLWRGEIVWWVHLFQNADHTMLCALLLAHLSELILRNSCLLVPFLQLFMCDEVLCHDAWDFLIVVKDGESGIFDLSLRWTETAEGVVHVDCRFGFGLTIGWT